ncbi:hypothetical protein TYRP_009400 [Tyrophagus putrescentiae]|nr:hypothetical protein TYRP_009400 [Tyrophagus putrescentiae]
MASPNVSPVETATTPATTPSPPKNQQMKKKKKKGSPIKVSAAAAVPWGRKASSPSSLPQTPPPPRSPPKSSAESPPASVLSSTSSVAAERERGKRGGVRNILPRSSGVQLQQQLPQSRLQPSGVDFGGDAEAKMVVVLMKGGGKSQAVMGPKSRRRRGLPVQSATVNGINKSVNTGGGSVFGSTTPAALTSAFPDYQQQQRKKKADRGR